MTLLAPKPQNPYFEKIISLNFTIELQGDDFGDETGYFDLVLGNHVVCLVLYFGKVLVVIKDFLH